MQWDFPAPVGAPLEVRLYFANGYPGTSDPGQRVFDVSLEGDTVLDNYDIVADVGDSTGTMKDFDITSDGNVDIDFSHVAENPLVRRSRSCAPTSRRAAAVVTTRRSAGT